MFYTIRQPHRLPDFFRSLQVDAIHRPFFLVVPGVCQTPLFLCQLRPNLIRATAPQEPPVNPCAQHRSVIGSILGLYRIPFRPIYTLYISRDFGMLCISLFLSRHRHPCNPSIHLTCIKMTLGNTQIRAVHSLEHSPDYI